MATFEQVRDARALKIETKIAEELTRDPNAQIDYLWEQRRTVLAGTGGGGTSGGGLSSAQTTAAITAALEAAELEKIFANTDGVETALAEIIDRLERSRHWEYVEGSTETVSSDDAALTTLTIPTAIAAIDSEDVQVWITTNLNSDIATVYHGGAVTGLSQVAARAIAADTFRYGYGTTLNQNEGNRLSGLEIQPLVVTSRADARKLEFLNTSAAWPSSINVKWFRRRFM